MANKRYYWHSQDNLELLQRLSANIYVLLSRSNTTKVTLAKACGINYNRLQHYMNCSSVMPVIVLSKIAKYFNCTEEALLHSDFRIIK